MTEGSATAKNISRMVDAGILMAALLIGFYLGRTSNPNRVPTGTTGMALEGRSRSPLTDPIGRDIALSGVDFQKNQRTLVLALQTTCRFCTESGPFYQKLVQERARFGRTKFVAVLPQSAEESRTYLSNLGVAVDHVVQGSLRDIGVNGTPTLLLVNSAGIVTEAWSRKLPPAGEEAVLARLRIKN